MKEEKNRIKILGITGPSGCGKDTAARHLAKINPMKYHYVKLHTTRPQRNYEDDGYHFIGPTKFLEGVMNGDMLSAQEFRGWYYGLHKDAMQEGYINILPMNDQMVEQMREENRDDYELKIIYLVTTDKERLTHILNREINPDCSEVCRRFLTDEQDYNIDNFLKKINATVLNLYNDKFFSDLEQIADKLFEGD